MTDRFKPQPECAAVRLVCARLIVVLLWVAPLCFGLPAGADEYRLTAGDRVELNVFRVPELDRTAAVDVDGRIAVPPLGAVEAAGATVDELAARIRDRLIEEMSLEDVQVTVALIAASPIFVGGDVAEPGAYPSEGRLTVRRAVALAGGVGILRGTQPEEVPRLRGELRSALLDLERDRATLARISAEIAGRATLDGAPLLGLERDGESGGESGPDQGGVPVLRLESQQLAANIAEADAEKDYLEQRVTLAGSRLERLNDQRGIQTGMMERQLVEVRRLEDTVDRGLGLQSRANDERRFYDGLQERLSDTDARIADAEAGLADARYEVARFDDRRRTQLNVELQQAGLAVRTGEARIDALAGQLAQLGVGDRRLGLDITVYRTRNGVEEALAATQDMALEPGDMVEVVQQLPTLAGAGDPLPAEPAAVSQ